MRKLSASWVLPMTKVILTSGAKADLVETKRYIADSLHNPIAAKKTVAGITKHLHVLEQFPEAGTPLEQEEGAVKYRYLVCGSYMAFYHLDDERVLIDRVLYGRRDYLGLLFGAELNDDFE